MANTDVRGWGDSRILSQNPTSTSVDYADTVNVSDDGFDFPPTAHPIRELITFSIFVSGIIALIIWGGSKIL
jgi:hypothetical protein